MAKNDDVIITPRFRAAWTNVFVAKLSDLSGKEEFSLVAIFPPDADLTGMRNAVKAAGIQKFGADMKKWPSNLKNPLRKCEEREKDGELPPGYEVGGHFCTFKSLYAPQIIDGDRQDIIDPAKVYAGMWARASVSPYGWGPIKGNAGVSFGLRNIQKMADGEPLVVRVQASDQFEPVAMAPKATADVGGGADDFDPFS